MQYEVIRIRELFPALCGAGDPEKNRNAFTAGRQLAPCRAQYREPTLTAYVPDNSPEIDPERKRTSVLICPGGGYEFVSFREAEPVALALAGRGYNAFVLDYDVAPVEYPQALLQASAALALIRQRAVEFHAHPDRIAVCGFSAGGHLAASLGVFWNEPFLRESLAIPQGQNRPNAMILSYPVITSGPFAHEGSFVNLMGTRATPELREKLSLEKQVNGDVPPAFLWHTFEDGAVPVENSLLFANALRQHDIPFELHIFPSGSHGLSLCSPLTDGSGRSQPHPGNWFSLCCEWLEAVFSA